MRGVLPAVSVVIPTFRRPDALKRTLEALTTVSYPVPIEVIVVDDGSGDMTHQMITSFRAGHPKLHLRYIEQNNSGAASARNRGAAEATGEILIFLDDDMIVTRDHVDRHVAHLGAVGARKIVNGHWEFSPEVRAELERSPFGNFRIELENWFKAEVVGERIDGGVLRPKLVTACNLGISRKDFLGLGGFDETFPAAGYEDQDFAIRAQQAGLEFVYDTRIALSHLDQRTTLDDFARRIKQGALTAGIMANKYPDEFGTSSLINENSPITSKDGWKVIVKKVVKAIASSIAGRTIVRTWISVLEVVAPDSKLMRTAYWKWSGIWIYLGVKEGLRSSTSSG